MHVKLKKTFTQVVSEQDDVAVATEDEIKAVEAEYDFPCSFCGAGCTARFKCDAAMQQHRISCTFNYGTTANAFPVEEVRAVFGKRERRLFKVKWQGYAEDHPKATTREPKYLLLMDGCKESIDEFWSRTELNPLPMTVRAKHRCWICGWKTESKRPGVLKAHLTRAKHKWSKQKKARVHAQAKKDIKKLKLEAMHHER